MILLIDNYDSFVFNLERYFRRLGQETRVVRNDEIDSAQVLDLSPRAVVFSPGPCAPQQAGNSLSLATSLAGRCPMLGVCLGHQILAAAFGAAVVRAAQPMHGRTSRISHDGQGVFEGLPSPLQVCRYHSLVVEPGSLPECLEASAHTADGVLMAFRHRSLPIVGLQFHPEAILTRGGYQMLRQFLLRAGVNSPPAVDDEYEAPAKPKYLTPALDRPITF